MTTTNANTMTAQELHAAVTSKAISVADAIRVLEERIAKAEQAGRKPRAPSVKLLEELRALKPNASPAKLANPVDALKSEQAAKRAAKPAEPAKAPAKPAKPAKPAAKAADAEAKGLTDAQLLDLVRERASGNAAFRSAIGKLFIELTQA